MISFMANPSPYLNARMSHRVYVKKVSDQLEVSKPALQLVVNKR